MPRSCVRCGGVVAAWVGDGQALACPHCGASGPALGKLIVITGAAATGKSTIASALAGVVPRAALIDGDVISAGAVAVSGAQRDYPAYWRYVLRLCHELAANGLTPVVCQMALPDQLEANAEHGWFTSVEYLALTCAATELPRRIHDRPGAGGERQRVAFHLDFDATLRRLAASRADVTALDVTALDRARLLEAVQAWLTDRLP